MRRRRFLTGLLGLAALATWCRGPDPGERRGPSGETYDTVEMREVFEGEDERRGVTYLDEKGRARYEVFVVDGQLVWASGKPIETRWSRGVAGGGHGIFVMDGEGHFYVARELRPGKFHHSSFLSGGPVAAAGSLRAKKGQLLELTNRSGHYLPDGELVEQLVHELEARGYPADDVPRRYIPRE